MISIDIKERSTWRGIIMVVTGIIALGFLAPIIFEMFNATSQEHLQLLIMKSTAIASAIGLIGQTVSGLIGTLFADKAGKND